MRLQTAPALATLLVLTLTTACGATTVPDAIGPASVPAGAPVSSTPTPAHGFSTVEITFYGGPDNDPPGSTDIAYPNSRHGVAGGTGTYDDPITLATDAKELPPGTVVYVASLEKYFVMEDDCADCITDWQRDRTAHLDLWTGPTGGASLLKCEDALTPPGPVTVEINPPPTRAVNTQPLYSADGSCQARAA